MNLPEDADATSGIAGVLLLTAFKNGSQLPVSCAAVVEVYLSILQHLSGRLSDEIFCAAAHCIENFPC